ncbi:MAG: CPBP family intramembrane metalloprotease, partial [Bacteroidales bacterium]|nr:CPBP family intramembrane metalloprotease [Bacteroidales bacterium]
MSDVGCRMWNVGCGMSDVECGMADVGCRVEFGGGCRMWNVGWRMGNVGWWFWILDFGFWFGWCGMGWGGSGVGLGLPEGRLDTGSRFRPRSRGTAPLDTSDSRPPALHRHPLSGLSDTPPLHSAPKHTYNKKQPTINSAIIILTFLIAYYGRKVVSDYIEIPFTSDYQRIAYYYLWWLLPTALVAGQLYGYLRLMANLGLQKGLLRGLLFAAIAVSPMMISSAIVGRIDEELSVAQLLKTTLFAGLMEEYLFRGFLFGLLFRKIKWGFIPASLLGAVIFGMGHLYHGNTLAETLGIFLITAMGAVWFAWLYIEWNNNLWVPVFLHILMNLSWTLFDISDTALGGWYANLFRILTIALTVIITIKYQQKSGLKINRTNLLKEYLTEGFFLS